MNAAHDCSDGGLATAVAEMAFAGGYGMDLDLSKAPQDDGLEAFSVLFSESLSRLVLTVPAAKVDDIGDVDMCHGTNRHRGRA